MAAQTGMEHAPQAANQSAPADAYAPPNPRAEALRLLRESRDELAQALELLEKSGDASKSADLVGRSSDKVGRALHHLRYLQRG